MKQLIHYLIFVFSAYTIISCTDTFDENNTVESENKHPKLQEKTIVIKTNSHFPDMNILSINPIKTRSEIMRDSLWADEFGKSLFGESRECVILSGDDAYIFPGALFQAKSVESGIYKPITADIKPIDVSISAPIANPSGVINTPTVKETRTFIGSKLNQSGVGEQSTSLFIQQNQFTSYDELKMAFGTNTKINAIFFSKTSSTSEKIHKISKRTGIYCKFIQKNFTLDMDIPRGGKLINGNLTSLQTGGYDPVYVKSVAYGQMGIFTLETDLSYDVANTYLNEAFNYVFLKKTSYLSNEAKQMLSSAEMSVYLIGPGSNGVAQVVDGYEGFLEYIKSSGKFSSTNPGVPIYCTYAHLSDNSPARVNFRIDVATDPVYARIEYRNKKESYSSTYGNQNADIYLAFYSDKFATRTTVAPLYITFYINKYSERQNNRDWSYSKVFKETGTIQSKINSFKKTEILIEPQGVIYEYESNYAPPEDRVGTGYGIKTITILQGGSFYKSLTPLNQNKIEWQKEGPWNQ